MPIINASASDTTWLTSLRRAVDERLQPPFLWPLGFVVLVVGLAMLVVSYVTSDRGRTAFGPPFGADFAGFYAAAQVLESGQASRLYDHALHDQFYHALLPNLDEKLAIPYVHPPFVAAALRPFTQMPYETAVLAWLGVSGALYLGGCLLLLRATPGLSREQWGLALLLAGTFEPFLMECWMGGQLSAVGFFSFALAFYFQHAGRLFASGAALGLCLYKPTFLVLCVPLLLWSRSWRMLSGMAATLVVLALLSVAAVGWDVCLGYLDVLLAFRKSTTGAGLELPTWKYIDLNNVLQGILGTGSPMSAVLLVALAAVPLGFLLRAWWRWADLDDPRRRLVWAATLTWTPVLNLYVGVYDSVIVVQSAVITAGILVRRAAGPAPLTSSGFAYLLLLVGVSAWFSQSLAKLTGVQVYTLALAGLGVYQLVLIGRHVFADRTDRSLT